MGCIPSTSADKQDVAAATQQAKGATEGHGAQGVHAQEKSGAQNGNNVKAEQRAVNTAVLRQANVFDQLHEQAHKEPSLRDVKVSIGAHNQRLLDGFEKKEREAREQPRLQNVEKSDLRSSKLFDKLQEFEMNDERVRMEPKLQNSFQQRQREMQRAGAGREAHSNT